MIKKIATNNLSITFNKCSTSWNVFNKQSWKHWALEYANPYFFPRSERYSTVFAN